MKSNQNIFSAIIAILALSSLIWLFYDFKVSQTTEVNTQSNFNEEKIISSAYTFMMKSQWELENVSINCDLQLYDKEKNKFSFFDRYEGQQYFVVYFSWDECQDCIKQELSHLNKISNYIQPIIIISFRSMVNFLAYANSWEFEYPLYYLPYGQKLYEGHKKEYGVHTFVLKNGAITHPHIASASFPELSEIYYGALNKKYEGVKR